VAELADLASGRHSGRSGRSGEQQITVFKSVGTALEDLSAAKLAWADYQA
jgi:ornithine cyclodeaminase